MTDDRTVHATLEHGTVEIVRYDRAGKWFIEHRPHRMIPAQHVGVRDAARHAVEGDAFVHFGRPGGRMFDLYVRRYREKRS